MAIEPMIVWSVIVAAAGYLASLTMTRGRGFGTIGNIVVGILGSFFGGAILPRLVEDPSVLARLKADRKACRAAQ